MVARHCTVAPPDIAMITEQTRRRLASLVSFECASAIQELAAEAPDVESLDLLLPFLAVENPLVRDTAVNTLAGWAAHPLVCDALLGQLTTAGPEAAGAVRALHPQAADPGVWQALLARLARPPHESSVQAAISAALVPQAANPRVLDELLCLVRAARAPVFQAAVATLSGQLANPLVLDALLTRLADPDRLVRQTAVQALRLWIYDPAVRTALRPLREDRDLGVRQMVSGFLGDG